MKTFLLAISFGFLCLLTQAQPDSLFKPFGHKYLVDTIQSESLQAKRTVRIYLPSGFTATGKYPVLYVLDASWMFEPAVNDVIKLSGFNVIPKCIVVGINSPNRQNDLRPNLTTGVFTETSRKFNEFVAGEVPKHIAKKYSAPVFNILVGHSDGATFAQNAMVSNPGVFRAVICLSQNLFGNELEQYINYSKSNFPDNRYYFIASGKRDATSRIKTGMRLDSLFQTNTNPHLKAKQEIYDADHGGVAGMGLTDGISFVFSDYHQPNDWNGRLVDSLKKINMDPTLLIEKTMSDINKNYGTDTKPSPEGIMSLAFAIVTNKEQAKSYLDYRIKNTQIDDQFNSSAAQLYERISEYDIALEYWKKYLNDSDSYKQSFFYFRRPIELLAYKMNQPEKAIAFAEEWEKKAPLNISLSFKFFIAKVAAEKNVVRKKGKADIDYFIKNYDPAKTQYDPDEAKKIKVQLDGGGQ